MKVKKVFPFSLWLLVLCFFLAACGGDGGGSSSGGGGNGGGGSSPTTSNDSPGKIPGLGNTSGNLQGTSFALPSGVTLVGSIGVAGVNGKSFLTFQSAEGKVKALKDLIKNINIVDGNYNAQIGSGWVPIVLTLKNSTTGAIKVTFPARLILRPRNNQYQDTVLLKEASVTIPSQQNYTIVLVMYCGNLNRLGLDGTGYEWGVISNSTTLTDLTDRLVHKQINVEDFAGYYDINNYSDRWQKLQDILWNLTDNGVALSDADKQWIASIPNTP